jgi:hypothetical protein
VTPSIYEDVPELFQFKAVNDPEKTLIEMDSGNKRRVLVSIARAAAQAALEANSN